MILFGIDVKILPKSCLNSIRNRCVRLKISDVRIKRQVLNVNECCQIEFIKRSALLNEGR